LIEHSDRIINNLEKLDRKRRQIKPSIDKQMLDKGEELIRKSIYNYVPSKNVVEFDFIVDEIHKKTQIKHDVIVEALMKSEPRDIILTEVQGRVFLKRNRP